MPSSLMATTRSRRPSFSALMVLSTTGDKRPTTASLNFQHPTQRHLRPLLNIILHFALVHDIAFNQVLQHPAQMLRRNAEHGRAQPAGITDRTASIPYSRKSSAQASAHMNYPT